MFGLFKKQITPIQFGEGIIQYQRLPQKRPRAPQATGESSFVR